MRVEVDRDLCESNAVCVGVAPEIFELDETDIAVVTTAEVPVDRESEVREAVHLCPKIALSLREDSQP